MRNQLLLLALASFAGTALADQPQQAGGLKISLAGEGRLTAAKTLMLTLTFTNQTAKDFQIILPDQQWCGLQNDLRVAPELKTTGSPHTVKPGYYPGSVHTVPANKSIELKFPLRRSADGRKLLVSSHNDKGCGGFLLVPSDLDEITVRFRQYDGNENWANLKFTGPRWSGMAVSNPVTIKLK